jgi:hypothetical protein
MDLEQELRASLVPPDPGVPFTDAVMARLEREVPARRRRHAGPAGSRRRNRIIIIGIVAAAGVAAAILALHPWGARHQALEEVVVAAPVPSPPAILAPEGDAGTATAAPAPVSTAVDASDAPAPEPTRQATAAPAKQQSVHYTVVATLRQDSTDEVARATAAEFFELVVGELRKIPGVTARVRDAANPDAPAEGEYGLSVTSLATQTTANGFTTVRTELGSGSFNGSRLGNPVPVEWRVDRGGTQASRPLESMTPLLLARPGATRPAQCATADRPEMGTGTLCSTAAELASREVEKLRLRTFPLDPGLFPILEARIADSTLGQRQRMRALSDLTLAMRRKDEGRMLDGASAAAIIKLVADLPSMRSQAWRSLSGIPHPDLIAPLVDSLEPVNDESLRQDALNTLLADYANDPRARASFEAVARGDASGLLRALAGYGLSGVDGWRSYVRQTLEREELSAAERVRPLVFASDEASGDFQKAALKAMADDTHIVEAVLAIARAHANSDITQRGPVRRALYALTRSETGTVVPGSVRAQAAAMYSEWSGRPISQLFPQLQGTPSPSGSSASAPPK